MKGYYFLFIALVATACTYVHEHFPSDTKEPPSASKCRRFQVTAQSAKFYAERIQFEDASPELAESIDFVIHGPDTLMYLINYMNDKGWVVISGDKRTNPILASSESGRIDQKSLGGSTVWFEDLADRIQAIKISNNSDTLCAFYKMWSNIDTLAFGLKRTKRSQESNLRSKYKGVELEKVLIDTKIQITLDKKVGPLIQTKWGQDTPWNECTPFWQDSQDRCLTGCVAVGGAQMLYYFHYFKGIPKQFYSRGECIGRVYDKKNKFIHFEFSDPSDSSWDKMDKMTFTYPPIQTEGTKLVSLLMGYVGKEVDMEYGKEGSGALHSYLTSLYSSMGIKSQKSEYSEELVRSSLDESLPVNISAFIDKKKKKILYIIPIGWEYVGGHSWIIDGYKDKKTRYTYTYQWLPKFEIYDPNAPHELTGYPLKDPDPKPIHKPGDIVVYKHDERTYYWTMNFGWDGGSDNADYSTFNVAIWDAGGHQFQYGKTIIHNFKFN